MTRLIHRQTAPGVRDGKVRRKNNWRRSPDHDVTTESGVFIDPGSHHIVIENMEITNYGRDHTLLDGIRLGAGLTGDQGFDDRREDELPLDLAVGGKHTARPDHRSGGVADRPVVESIQSGHQTVRVAFRPGKGWSCL